MKVIVGLNDLADYVKDTFDKLLGRLPTTAEFAANQIKNMETARLTALGVVIKELLSTFNASEARVNLIQRLFNNSNAPGEIGHLLPGYTPTADDMNFYLNALKNGTKGPEGIITDIIATTNQTKGFYGDYYAAAGGTPITFLNRLYQDLYKGTGIQFSWLPANVQTTQVNQAATENGRLNLTRSLVSGALVRYHPNGNPATPAVTTYDHDNNPATAPVPLDFRTHMVNLTYQRYLGRAATPAEITSGKSLMARPLAINSINGSEWLYWKVMSSAEYFSRVPSQADGLPDDGLHTNRAWVQAILNDRMYRASTVGEEDTYSKKILDRFKTQRAAFVNSIVQSSSVLGTEYRNREITKYFQLAHARNPSDAERATDQTALKNGSTFTGLTAKRFASQEFFQTSAPQFAGGSASNTTWARAVYIRLFNLNLPANDPRITSLAAQGATPTTRQPAVASLLNSVAYRDILITDRFNLLLGRVPTPNELTAYQNFLKTRRWETLITDIIANGNASATITTQPAAAVLGGGQLTRLVATDNIHTGPTGTIIPAGSGLFRAAACRQCALLVSYLKQLNSNGR